MPWEYDHARRQVVELGTTGSQRLPGDVGKLKGRRPADLGHRLPERSH